MGQSATLNFTVAVDVGTATGPFFNQAATTTSATPGGPALFADLSHQGTLADPDGDGNPAEPGEDDETPVLISGQRIGLAKAATDVSQVARTVFDVTYTLTVRNLSESVPATNLQVTDDLAMAFPDVSKVSVVSVDADGLAPNGSFDGISDDYSPVTESWLREAQRRSPSACGWTSVPRVGRIGIRRLSRRLTGRGERSWRGTSRRRV